MKCPVTAGGLIDTGILLGLLGSFGNVPRIVLGHGSGFGGIGGMHPAQSAWFGPQS